MKTFSSALPCAAQRAHTRWFWIAGLLPGLLLAHASQAQTMLYNADSNILYQSGNIYSAGTVENAGTYVPASGTLLVAGGNFLLSGTGTIASSPAAATLLLQEANSSTAHTLTLGGTAPVSVTVYDATGRLLFQQQVAPAATLQLPSAAWASGPYLIRAQQGTQTTTRTLVHQ